jgi:hypothetical protein
VQSTHVGYMPMTYRDSEVMARKSHWGGNFKEV